MGVDWFDCDFCGESWNDCCKYKTCDCGKQFCTECNVFLENIKDEDGNDTTECNYCTTKSSKISLTVDEKYEYLLKIYNLTDEDVTEIITGHISKTKAR